MARKHGLKPPKTLNCCLRQRLVHTKDKTRRHNQSNVVCAVQCGEECLVLYVGETKQPLHLLRPGRSCPPASEGLRTLV